MVDNVEPIRAGITPELDVAREMVQFVSEKLDIYIDEYGEPPMSIAVVFVGPDRGDAATDAWSWSPIDESKSILHTCSVAAAVLWKRALGL